MHTEIKSFKVTELLVTLYDEYGNKQGKSYITLMDMDSSENIVGKTPTDMLEIKQ